MKDPDLKNSRMEGRGSDVRDDVRAMDRCALSSVEISVIVAVYNAGEYLLEALEALDCQSFRDYEVLLVDDGSTDSGPEQMDHFCAGHERFRVLHIANCGVYRARMTGLRAARGRYISFCDSDDLPQPEMLEKLYIQAEQTGADVTVCGFTREDMDSGAVRSREMLSFAARSYDFPELFDVLPVVNSSLWNKLFRAELLRHAICLEQPPRVAEDLMIICSLFPFLQCISFVPEELYRYRVRPGSAISSISTDDVEQARASMLLTREYVLQYQDSREMRELLDTVAFDHFGWAMVIRQVKSGQPAGKAVASARTWLGQHFPGYRKAGKGLLWNCKHGMLQRRFLIGRWIFCAHLMWPGLIAYDFITQKCGKEIKW